MNITQQLLDELEGIEDFGATRELHDYRYDATQEAYWDLKTGLLFSAQAVDSKIPSHKHESILVTKVNAASGKVTEKLVARKPSETLRDVSKGLRVETSTWHPGKPRLIEDAACDAAGMMTSPGDTCYNHYRPLNVDSLRSGGSPDFWIAHIKTLWPKPEEHNHLFDWMAFTIQHPEQKIQHCLLICGGQGIGKDLGLMPIRRGVGRGNCKEIGPDAVMSRFNGFYKSKLLVINEVHAHGDDIKAWAFYEQTKTLIANASDYIGVEEKFQSTMFIPNLVNVVMTTNLPHKMHIGADDRRFFVAHTEVLASQFPDGYFSSLVAYLKGGGADAAVLWLMQRDVSKFNPGATPPMTEGKAAIMSANNESRRSVVDDVFEAFVERHGALDVIFTADLLAQAKESLFDDSVGEFTRSVNGGRLVNRMRDLGYEAVKSDGEKWRYKEFKSRLAFIRSTVASELRPKAAREALKTRPLTAGPRPDSTVVEFKKSEF